VRRLLPVLVLVVVVLAAGCSAFGVRSSDAATVNGVAISNDQLKEMVQAQLGQQQAQQQQQQQQSLDIEGITRQSLEGLIQYQLVLEGARRAGVSIQEGDVDARLQQLKAQAAAQGTNFEDVLQARNISEKVVRDQLRIQLAIDLVAVKLVPYASDATLRQALDKRKKDFLQVHVRHVLVKDAGTAAAVRKELVGSGDWGAVAKRRSTDPQTKDKGGDLGFISKGQTAAAFEKAELDLANQGSCKGKTSGSCSSPISQPVKTQFGFHVLQVTGVRLPALDNNLRSQLQPAVKEQRQAAVQKWFDELVKQADVTVNPRYGRWDKGSGKVVDRETAPGSATSTTAPGGGIPVGP
jgi:parvulin-like peptidyl-prolyl isomerase